MPLKRKKQPSEALKCVRVGKVTLKREKRILGLFFVLAFIPGKPKSN